MLRVEAQPRRDASGRDAAETVGRGHGDAEALESRGRVAGEGAVDGVQERGRWRVEEDLGPVVQEELGQVAPYVVPAAGEHAGACGGAGAA